MNSHTEPENKNYTERFLASPGAAQLRQTDRFRLSSDSSFYRDLPNANFLYNGKAFEDSIEYAGLNLPEDGQISFENATHQAAMKAFVKRELDIDDNELNQLIASIFQDELVSEAVSMWAKNTSQVMRAHNQVANITKNKKGELQLDNYSKIIRSTISFGKNDVVAGVIHEQLIFTALEKNIEITAEDTIPAGTKRFRFQDVWITNSALADAVLAKINDYPDTNIHSFDVVVKKINDLPEIKTLAIEDDDENDLEVKTYRQFHALSTLPTTFYTARETFNSSFTPTNSPELMTSSTAFAKELHVILRSLEPYSDAQGLKPFQAWSKCVITESINFLFKKEDGKFTDEVLTALSKQGDEFTSLLQNDITYAQVKKKILELFIKKIVLATLPKEVKNATITEDGKDTSILAYTNKFISHTLITDDFFNAENDTAFYTELNQSTVGTEGFRSLILIRKKIRDLPNNPQGYSGILTPIKNYFPKLYLPTLNKEKQKILATKFLAILNAAELFVTSNTPADKLRLPDLLKDNLEPELSSVGNQVLVTLRLNALMENKLHTNLVENIREDLIKLNKNIQSPHSLLHIIDVLDAVESFIKKNDAISLADLHTHLSKPITTTTPADQLLATAYKEIDFVQGNVEVACRLALHVKYEGEFVNEIDRYRKQIIDDILAYIETYPEENVALFCRFLHGFSRLPANQTPETLADFFENSIDAKKVIAEIKKAENISIQNKFEELQKETNDPNHWMLPISIAIARATEQNNDTTGFMYNVGKYNREREIVKEVNSILLIYRSLAPLKKQIATSTAMKERETIISSLSAEDQERLKFQLDHKNASLHSRDAARLIFLSAYANVLNGIRALDSASRLSQRKKDTVKNIANQLFKFIDLTQDSPDFKRDEFTNQLNLLGSYLEEGAREDNNLEKILFNFIEEQKYSHVLREVKTNLEASTHIPSDLKTRATNLVEAIEKIKNDTNPIVIVAGSTIDLACLTAELTSLNNIVAAKDSELFAKDRKRNREELLNDRINYSIINEKTFEDYRTVLSNVFNAPAEVDLSQEQLLFQNILAKKKSATFPIGKLAEMLGLLNTIVGCKKSGSETTDLYRQLFSIAKSLKDYEFLIIRNLKNFFNIGDTSKRTKNILTQAMFNKGGNVLRDKLVANKIDINPNKVDLTAERTLFNDLKAKQASRHFSDHKIAEMLMELNDIVDKKLRKVTEEAEYRSAFERLEILANGLAKYEAKQSFGFFSCALPANQGVAETKRLINEIRGNTVKLQRR